MAEIINVSIDLTKIDKSRITPYTKKDGSEAKYYNMQIFINDEQDKYGNICSVSQAQTKEENEAKTPKVFLGNGKRVWASGAKTADTSSTPVPKEQASKDPNDDLPF